MNLVALKRVLVWPLALAKYQKKNPLIKTDDLYVLLVLSKDTSGLGMTKKEIADHLSSNFHTRSSSTITNILTKLEKEGWAEPSSNTSQRRYITTLAGASILNDFEKVLREFPFPKPLSEHSQSKKN